mmetsp:Transcript_5203/g.13193  ORF Transcript_5203/g.13193 Transcript_5203/m.13193 type:complete len:608 (-) Transcript_5203:56-1879(-)
MSRCVMMAPPGSATSAHSRICNAILSPSSSSDPLLENASPCIPPWDIAWANSDKNKFSVPEAARSADTPPLLTRRVQLPPPSTWLLRSTVDTPRGASWVARHSLTHNSTRSLHNTPVSPSLRPRAMSPSDLLTCERTATASNIPPWAEWRSGMDDVGCTLCSCKSLSSADRMVLVGNHLGRKSKSSMNTAGGGTLERHSSPSTAWYRSRYREATSSWPFISQSWVLTASVSHLRCRPPVSTSDDAHVTESSTPCHTERSTSSPSSTPGPKLTTSAGTPGTPSWACSSLSATTGHSTTLCSGLKSPTLSQLHATRERTGASPSSGCIAKTATSVAGRHWMPQASSLPSPLGRSRLTTRSTTHLPLPSHRLTFPSSDSVRTDSPAHTTLQRICSRPVALAGLRNRLNPPEDAWRSSDLTCALEPSDGRLTLSVTPEVVPTKTSTSLRSPTRASAHVKWTPSLGAKATDANGLSLADVLRNCSSAASWFRGCGRRATRSPPEVTTTSTTTSSSANGTHRTLTTASGSSTLQQPPESSWCAQSSKSSRHCRLLWLQTRQVRKRSSPTAHEEPKPSSPPAGTRELRDRSRVANLAEGPPRGTSLTTTILAGA